MKKIARFLGRIRIFFIIICFLALLSTSAEAFSYKSTKAGGPSHQGDFYQVFEGIEGKNMETLYSEISSNVIDKRLEGLPGNHRNFGHWGFSGSIPFNEEPLKSLLEGITDPQ